MIDVVKSKSHMIGKLFVYQIASSLLGLFVASPFSGKMQMVAAIFSTLFYFALIAYAVIEDGQKDCVSSKTGACTVNSNAGFVYSIVSYLPTIVFVIVQMIIIFCTDTVIEGVKLFFSIVIRIFLMGMYLGFENGLSERFQDPVTHQMVSGAGETARFICDSYILFAVLLVLMPLVCGICYKLAYNGVIHVNTEVKKKK